MYRHTSGVILFSFIFDQLESAEKLKLLYEILEDEVHHSRWYMCTSLVLYYHLLDMHTFSC